MAGKSVCVGNGEVGSGKWVFSTKSLSNSRDLPRKPDRFSRKTLFPISYILFPCLLLALLPLASCKGKANASKGPEVLRWAIWDKDLTVYYQPLVEAFQAKHPGLRMELIDLGSADYTTMLITQLSGGAEIDVISVKDIPGYSNLVKQNRLAPLGEYVEKNNVDTSIYNGIVEQITVNGNYYALPFRSDFWVVFYNKDIFDRQGVPYPTNDMTLDQYDALARQVAHGDGASRVYGAHYHTWRSAVQLFGILDGKHTIVDGNYEFLAPYYNRVLSAQKDAIVPAYATLKTSGTHYSGAFFNEQSAMVNMGTWFIATQIEKVRVGESKAVNWGIVKYPHPEGVPAGTTLGTITSLGMNKATKWPDTAFEFIKFVSGPEGALILAKTGTIPAVMSEQVVSTLSSVPGFPPDEQSKEALEVTKTYLEMPLNEKSADIETALNEEHDGIMTGGESVEEGLANMGKRVRKILGKE